jgi:hypothetical protein
MANYFKVATIVLGRQFVTCTGNDIFVNGTLYGVNHFDSGLAAATGQILYADLTGLSGQNNTNFATIANLTQTGITIENQINSLSGFTTGLSGFASLNYATIFNLTQTGVIIETQINSLSGFTSGSSGFLQTEINNLFTNLTSTGQTLYNDILGLSGIVNTTITNLGTTGSNLYTLLTNFSGNANSVVKVTGSSIIPTANFTGIGGTIVFTSGGFVFISGGAGGGSFDPLGTAANTGQILYNDLTGLSGQSNTNFATITSLTQTGVIIEGQLTSLSGFVTGVSGYLATHGGAGGSNVQVTGSSNLSLANFTGINGASVSLISGMVVINGNVIASGSEVYVNQLAGSDTNGNGTITQPFATIGKALAVVSGSNTATNPYTIKVSAGNYAEGLSLLPWVWIVGESVNGGYIGNNNISTPFFTSPTQISGTIVIDPSWSGSNQRGGMMSLFSALGMYTFTAIGVSQAILDIYNFSSAGSITVFNRDAYSAINLVNCNLARLTIWDGNNYISNVFSKFGVNFNATMAGSSNVINGLMTSPGQNLQIQGAGGGTAFNTYISNSNISNLYVYNSGAVAYVDAVSYPTQSPASPVSNGQIILQTTALALGYNAQNPSNWSGLGSGLVPTTVQAALDQLAGLNTITGAYIPFVFRPNFGISGLIENQFIPFSGTFGSVPMVTYSIINNSGDPILAHYLSGITNSGFNIVFSAAPTTSNYNISFMATTGAGFIYL